MQASTATTVAAPHKPFYTHLYAQVLTAIVFGVLLGYFYPQLGEQMKPLGDGFIKLIKMLIAPIIFCTVVHGIASMEDLKKVGRVGLKALIYFEGVTTLALLVGLVVVNVLQPGVGMNVDTKTLDTKSIQVYTTKAGQQSTVEFLMHIIPNTVVGAFAEGEILQVLFFAILFAFALFMLGERGKPVLNFIDIISHSLFNVVGIVMKVAPIGAFGAMAFTIGKYGVGTLLSLGKLMAAFYVTCLIFIFVVLGGIAWLTGFNIWKFIKYIKEELLIVLGTSSSESVLPRMINKLENLGCKESVVGLGHSHRVFVQPGWDLHLSDNGGNLSGAGNQHRAHDLATTRHHRDTASDVERSSRGYRQRLHRACGDACFRRLDPSREHRTHPGS
jgi:aerobic C4-dicarboxylate transport protein